ncbi:MAG: hypothetical protein RSF79_25375 [Janthinobacterium sp.]
MEALNGLAEKSPIELVSTAEFNTAETSACADFILTLVNVLAATAGSNPAKKTAGS